MNSQIQALLVPAIKYIESTKKWKDDDKRKDESFFNKKSGKVAKEYKGYISSFGTAVMQSGLKVAVALFSDKSSGGEQSKLPIVNALRELVISKDKKDENSQSDYEQYPSLIAYVIDPKHDNNGVRKKVLNATIALKLALRTFEIDK